MDLDGPHLTKDVLETALEAEMSEHPGTTSTIRRAKPEETPRNGARTTPPRLSPTL